MLMFSSGKLFTGQNLKIEKRKKIPLVYNSRLCLTHHETTVAVNQLCYSVRKYTVEDTSSKQIRQTICENQPMKSTQQSEDSIKNKWGWTRSHLGLYQLFFHHLGKSHTWRSHTSWPADWGNVPKSRLRCPWLRDRDRRNDGRTRRCVCLPRESFPPGNTNRPGHVTRCETT